MKYRKKPVVIEAHQLTKENWCEVAHWAGGTHGTGKGMYIPTLEGDMHAEWGDYIICGVKGEFYPCKPDIFEMTYEPAS